jgi:hypothetical protein
MSRRRKDAPYGRRSRRTRPYFETLEARLAPSGSAGEFFLLIDYGVDCGAPDCGAPAPGCDASYVCPDDAPFSIAIPVQSVVDPIFSDLWPEAAVSGAFTLEDEPPHDALLDEEHVAIFHDDTAWLPVAAEATPALDDAVINEAFATAVVEDVLPAETDAAPTIAPEALATAMLELARPVEPSIWLPTEPLPAVAPSTARMLPPAATARPFTPSFTRFSTAFAIGAEAERADAGETPHTANWRDPARSATEKPIEPAARNEMSPPKVQPDPDAAFDETEPQAPVHSADEHATVAALGALHEAALPVAAPAFAPPRGGLAAALLLWCVLLVASCRRSAGPRFGWRVPCLRGSFAAT